MSRWLPQVIASGAAPPWTATYRSGFSGCGKTAKAAACGLAYAWPASWIPSAVAAKGRSLAYRARTAFDSAVPQRIRFLPVRSSGVRSTSRTTGRSTVFRPMIPPRCTPPLRLR